jgi:putative ABC transport system substrate-binding protein
LELLKEVVPTLSHVGIIRDAEGSGSRVALKEYDDASHALKIQIQALNVKAPNPELEGAFQAAAKRRAGAVITITGTLLSPHAKTIADLATKNRLPSMHEHFRYVDAGGLMSYSGNDDETFRRAAHYVDKILKGAKPADLPVEQPMKFDFVVNLKTAKQIGLTIPQWTLMKADRVIR